MKRRPKILIVEDDTPVAMMAVHLLTHAGCDVLAAHTGVKGLELARESRFGLIALDVDLPDMSGFEICRQLKQRHISRNTPVIFVSGRASEQDARHGLELGAVDFIAKPFDASDFVSRILSHVQETKECVSRP